MDAGFLNFHKESGFSSYFLSGEKDSKRYNELNAEKNLHWSLEHLEYERELNGDVGLIPIAGDTSFVLSTSPPYKEDYNKIMYDWNHLVNLEVGNDLVADMAASASTTLQFEAAVLPVDDAIMAAPPMNIKQEMMFECTEPSVSAMIEEGEEAVDEGIGAEGFAIGYEVVAGESDVLEEDGETEEMVMDENAGHFGIGKYIITSDPGEDDGEENVLTLVPMNIKTEHFDLGNYVVEEEHDDESMPMEEAEHMIEHVEPNINIKAERFALENYVVNEPELDANIHEDIHDSVLEISPMKIKTERFDISEYVLADVSDTSIHLEDPENTIEHVEADLNIKAEINPFPDHVTDMHLAEPLQDNIQDAFGITDYATHNAEIHLAETALEHAQKLINIKAERFDISADPILEETPVGHDDIKADGFDITKFVVGHDTSFDMEKAVSSIQEVEKDLNISAERFDITKFVVDDKIMKLPETIVDHVEDDIKAEGFDITKYVCSESDTSFNLSEMPIDGETDAEVDDGHIKAEGFDITKFVNGDNSDFHIEPEMPAKSVVKAEIGTSTTTASIVQKVEEDHMKVVCPAAVIPQPKFGGKRIDMARGRYLVDESSEESSDEEDEDISIDVETVETATPVLQAGDLDSLLEQFEATESTNMSLQPKITKDEVSAEISDFKLEAIAEPVKLLSPIKTPRKLKAAQKKRKLEYKEQKTKSKVESKTKIEETAKRKAIKKDPLPPPEVPTKDPRKNKQILETLPTELIDRIRQSSKRKAVPVIEPIAPVKRRNASQITKEKPAPVRTAVNPSSKIINNVDNDVKTNVIPKQVPESVTATCDRKNIKLDHDYCTSSTTTQKDSGFSSCEEEEKAIIRTQPTVKSSDGKLMVSLLKTNTIKKKLNLEEYKKRLQTKTSGDTSPTSMHDDDENTRRLKHTEMLMKMAQDLIKDKNADEVGMILPPILAGTSPNAAETPSQAKKQDEDVQIIDVKPAPPKNITMKTLVSMGTNTEESWGHVEQILQNANIKISPNSLISSIVEHLPKPKPVIASQQVEHGEDKTIVIIDSTHPPKKTKTVHVQTVHSSIALRHRRRQRTSSVSSSSSSSSRTSEDSLHGGRGRTPSPVRRRKQEQMKVFEERRVIYVGKIGDNTTKDDLHRRFIRFGPITNVSVHFRRHIDNYGFVTFQRKEDAFDAIDRGNEDPNDPEYDLGFGGRRLFCKTEYADLDNMPDDSLYDLGWSSGYTGNVDGGMKLEDDENSFDNLLRTTQAKLRKRML